MHLIPILSSHLVAGQDPRGGDQVRSAAGLRVSRGSRRGGAQARAGLPGGAVRQPARRTAQVREPHNT